MEVWDGNSCCKAADHVTIEPMAIPTLCIIYFVNSLNSYHCINQAKREEHDVGLICRNVRT